MLPLVLCWESVHKMQGSMVDKAVINFGSSVFAHGQANVSLSRICILEGLSLKELDYNKVESHKISNRAALIKYNAYISCLIISFKTKMKQLSNAMLNFQFTSIQLKS